MHVDRTNQIPMPGELAGTAHPLSAFGLVSMPTCRTAARCSSFRATEAHDVGSFGFVSEIIKVFAIFPQGHALIVVSSCGLVTDTMRIANEEGSHLLLDTEVDDGSRGFVASIANAPFSATALLVFGSLQLLPAPRIFVAAGLLLRNLAELLASLMFERTDTTSSDDHGLPGVGGDCRQMDLAQIDGRGTSAGCLFCLWYFYDDM
jgi:hypothetical protein